MPPLFFSFKQCDRYHHKLNVYDKLNAGEFRVWVVDEMNVGCLAGRKYPGMFMVPGGSGVRVMPTSDYLDLSLLQSDFLFYF